MAIVINNLNELMALDEASESGNAMLKIAKYIVALFLIISSTYIAFLQSTMATRFEVLSERIIHLNKQLDENRFFVQKLVLDLRVVELEVKELQFLQNKKKGK